MASVEVLNFSRVAQLKRKWNRLWAQIAERVLSLPQREQIILLEDFQTAIENRLVVMERINNAKKGN